MVSTEQTSSVYSAPSLVVCTIVNLPLLLKFSYISCDPAHILHNLFIYKWIYNGQNHVLVIFCHLLARSLSIIFSSIPMYMGGSSTHSLISILYPCLYMLKHCLPCKNLHYLLFLFESKNLQWRKE